MAYSWRPTALWSAAADSVTEQTRPSKGKTADGRLLRKVAFCLLASYSEYVLEVPRVL